MGLQVALFPQALTKASLDGLQTRAQNLAPDEDVNAQVGLAVTPGGTSVGHAPEESHGGEQKSPAKP